MDPSTTLPLTVTLVVLAAAVTHATWNAIAHGIKDQTLAFALIGAGGILIAIPLIIVTAMPRAACWPYLLGSVAIHVFYNLLLMRCYRLGEFGQVYPLARGTSPLVVTILAAIFVHEHLALAQISGVVVVSAGLAVLVLAGRRPSRAAFLAAVGTGLTIAAYTTVDGVGVRLSASPVGYIGWLMLLESLGVPMFALVRRRDVLLKQPRRILLAGLAAGALSVLAYGLVLWAQTRGALAPIAALRETSVIFGAIIGTLVFREPFGRTRIAATVLVVAGIVLLNFGYGRKTLRARRAGGDWPAWVPSHWYAGCFPGSFGTNLSPHNPLPDPRHGGARRRRVSAGHPGRGGIGIGIGIGLFLPRGTKRMRIWIKNDAPRKQYVTNSNH